MINNLIYNHDSITNIKNIHYYEYNINNVFVKKINIYNPEADEPLQKFWFYIKKASII